MELFYFANNKLTDMPALPSTQLTFYELTIVFSGSMEYFIDGKRVVLKSGNILFVPKNARRKRSPVNGCNYVSFNFYTDEEQDFLDLPLFIEDGITTDIRFLVNACTEIHEQLHESLEQLQLLCICILKQLKIHITTKKYSALTQKIKHYINEHLEDSISLEEIGKYTFFSPAYCSFVFKKEIGKSIVNYVIDEKIKKAKALIIDGIPFKDIAQRLGFTNYNYFSRIFKKRESMTPMKYKKSFELSK